jgi:4-amino-4-deoxy-L-arabinose transferase-like glycosyltransferase
MNVEQLVTESKSNSRHRQKSETATVPSVLAVGSRHAFPWSVLLGATALVGFALRMYRLDSQSVWYDEVFALSVSRLPFTQMHKALIQDLVHPPLHYYALHEWFRVFGFGVFQGRLLSALFGTLAVLMIYLLAGYLFDRRAALFSAVLLAFSQLAIMYSQEARPYAQFSLLYLGCIYLFLRALREKRWGIWLGFLCVACLLIYTHYYGFLAIASLLAFGFVRREEYSLSSAWLWGGICGVALGYAPWLWSGIVSEAFRGEKMQRLNTMAHSVSGPVHWFTLATAINVFNNGRPSGLMVSCPAWTFIVGGLLFCLPAALALLPLIDPPSSRREQARERENVLYLLLLFTVPIALALIAGLLYGTYDVKYVAFCAAPYYILVARGLSLGDSVAARRVMLTLILAYSVLSLRANYFVPYKEDYKHAIASIANDYQPSDCAVVAPPWEERQARWAWSIYEGAKPSPQVIPLNSATPGSGGCERVWLISVLDRSNPQAVRSAESARQQLTRTYFEHQRRSFFWVDVDLYANRGQFQAEAKAPR